MSKKRKSTKTERAIRARLAKCEPPEQHLRDRRKLFALADKYAEQTLFAALTGIETAIPESTDVLGQLTRASRYFNQEEFDAASGELLCACHDAGLMLGLAYGLRLRGGQ